MAYAWCVVDETHSLSRNRAQAPMEFLTGKGGIIDTYVHDFGVPLSKLGIILPWYGCNFACNPSEVGSNYYGCPNTIQLLNSPTYDDIVTTYLANSTEPNRILHYNTSVGAKVFSYRNGSGAHNQIWFDDPTTLATKYAAIKAAGVSAVGMWTADSAGSNAAHAAAMWAAVPST